MKPAEHRDLTAAAICVLAPQVRAAAAALSGSEVRVAAATGGFPGGRIPLSTKLAEINEAVDAGADEIDVVVDRTPLSSGDFSAVENEVRSFRKAAGPALLKVILETGELRDYSTMSNLAAAALRGGADMLKTSTGRARTGATVEAALVLGRAILRHFESTGTAAGLKVAGGIKKAGTAVTFMLAVEEILGPEWLHPDRFRIGASDLLDDLVGQLRSE